MSRRTDALLREAARRWMLHGGGNHTGGETLTTAWLGLGTGSLYRPAVKAGLMECATTPKPGHPTWWRLTDKGAAAMFTLVARDLESQAVTP